jgi:arsenate reductase (thioredoxin)
MAEAVLNRKAGDRFQAGSAGSHPAAAVNPIALEALRDLGIEWEGHQPRGLDQVIDGRWDLVITVCDSARDACPVFPGQSVTAHWGMPDPAAVEGSEAIKRAAFRKALQLINGRIARLVALPVEQLERAALAASVREIAEVE